MTPLHIRLLIHYHTMNEKWQKPSPAASDYTVDLVKWGLIEERAESPSGYRATERGVEHVEGLCRLALPLWVSPARGFHQEAPTK